MRRTRALLGALWACLLAASMADATPAPTDLTVSRHIVGDNFVTLIWTAPPGTITHRVYRTTSLPVVLSPANLLATPPSDAFADPLGPTPPYYYAVTAEDGSSPESILSNTAGYIAVEALGGIGNVYTTFTLPFVSWDVPFLDYPQHGTASTRPSDIVNDEAYPGLTPLTADGVIRFVGLQEAWYRPDQSWWGTLETSAAMTQGQPYYYVNRNSRPTRTVIIAGEVSNTNLTSNMQVSVLAPAFGQPSISVYVALPESRTLNVDQIELLTDGFQQGAGASGDLIISMGPVNQGMMNWHDGSSWHVPSFPIIPGQCYIIVNQGGASWTYDYNFSLQP